VAPNWSRTKWKKTDRRREDAMADKHILHMVTPLKHMSPFDINMAVDAGFDAVLTYANVTLDEVTGLVQDAIFSRPPKDGVKTGMFFGGKNATLALDMLAKAKKALVPPFGISFFADPNGSFTTAAAMVACVEKILREKKNLALKERKVAVFGATGVVGFSAAVIAGLEGADVTLVGYDGITRVSAAAAEIKARFEVDLRGADGSDDGKKAAILANAEIALCAGRAGVRRERGAADRRRGTGDDRERRRTHPERRVGRRPARDWKHQVQDRVRPVSKDDRGAEAGPVRLSRRVCAGARPQCLVVRRC
jgi:methylene-tetrahydromethanopterin dehydrogenase